MEPDSREPEIEIVPAQAESPPALSENTTVEPEKFLPVVSAGQANSRLDPNKLVLSGSILFAAVLMAGTLLYVNRDKLGNPGGAQIVQGGGEAGQPVAVSADDDAILGKKNAPVAIIEFSDFQCPFCRRFWEETLPQIKKEYIATGKAFLVYRDFPLDFHSGAEPAAEAAECAEEQGKFWEMHDKIFSAQGKQGTGTVQFGVADLKQWAKEIKLNSTQFNSCLDGGKYKEEVAKDIADGVAAGVSGTPTTFVNGQKIVGAQPFSAFKVVIDQELARSK